MIDFQELFKEGEAIKTKARTIKPGSYWSIAGKEYVVEHSWYDLDEKTLEHRLYLILGNVPENGRIHPIFITIESKEDLEMIMRHSTSGGKEVE